jgi:hypothetical protein
VGTPIEQCENLIDAAAAVLLNLTGAMKNQARRMKQQPIRIRYACP